MNFVKTFVGVHGTVMCGINTTLQEGENVTLTTSHYPAMVSAVQCRCSVSTNATSGELIVDVLVHRKDGKENCQTGLAIQYTNISRVICPTNHSRMAYTRLSLKLLPKSDGDSDAPITLTLNNPTLDFINAAIFIRTRKNISRYKFVC